MRGAWLVVVVVVAVAVAVAVVVVVVVVESKSESKSKTKAKANTKSRKQEEQEQESHFPRPHSFSAMLIAGCWLVRSSIRFAWPAEDHGIVRFLIMVFVWLALSASMLLLLPSSLQSYVVYVAGPPKPRHTLHLGHLIRGSAT